MSGLTPGGAARANTTRSGPSCSSAPPDLSPCPQHDQLLSKRGVRRLEPAFRLKGRSQKASTEEINAIMSEGWPILSSYNAEEFSALGNKHNRPLAPSPFSNTIGGRSLSNSGRFT